jgi:VanZ family protein
MTMGVPTQRTLYALLALLWMALIYHLSDQPHLPVPQVFKLQDKLAHAFVFGILGLLYSRLLSVASPFHWRKMIIVTLMVLTYGISDEIHQMAVPGRSPSLGDVIADVTGGALAAFLWLRLRGTKPLL